MTRTICHNLVVFRKTKRKETIFIANGVGRMKHKIITNGHYALVRHGLFELMTCEYSASSVDMPKKNIHKCKMYYYCIQATCSAYMTMMMIPFVRIRKLNEPNEHTMNSSLGYGDFSTI